MTSWHEKIEKLSQADRGLGGETDGERRAAQLGRIVEQCGVTGRTGVSQMLEGLNEEFWGKAGRVENILLDVSSSHDQGFVERAFLIGVGLYGDYQKPHVEQRYGGNGLSGEASNSSTSTPVSWSLDTKRTDICVAILAEVYPNTVDDKDNIGFTLAVIDDYSNAETSLERFTLHARISKGLKCNSRSSVQMALPRFGPRPVSKYEDHISLPDDQIRQYTDDALVRLCRDRVRLKRMLPDLRIKGEEEAKRLSQSGLPRTR